MTNEKIRRLKAEDLVDDRFVRKLEKEDAFKMLALDTKATVYSIVILSCSLLWISSLWADHKVGEPKLESLSIWKQCCSEHDCVPQDVQTIRKEKDGNINVRIEGIQTEVSKEKFSPVPSQRTWVCYVNPNGEIKNENIRCILYPQTGGTTDAIQLPHSKTAEKAGPQPAK